MKKALKEKMTGNYGMEVSDMADTEIRIVMWLKLNFMNVMTLLL